MLSSLASRWCGGNCKSLISQNMLRINTLRPRHNRRHFADDIFKCIFLNENVWITIKISLKFAPKGPINNIPALVQIMAWRRPGDKPLSEPMWVSLPTHICVTRSQWVKFKSSFYYIAPMEIPQDTFEHKSTLVQVMAWCRQATRHYLAECRPRFLSPYSATRPQWVNLYFLLYLLLRIMLNLHFSVATFLQKSYSLRNRKF